MIRADALPPDRDARRPRLQEPAPPRRRRSFRVPPVAGRSCAACVLLAVLRLAGLGGPPARRLGLPSSPHFALQNVKFHGLRRAPPSRSCSGSPGVAPGMNLWSAGPGRGGAGHGRPPVGAQRRGHPAASPTPSSSGSRSAPRWRSPRSVTSTSSTPRARRSSACPPQRRWTCRCSPALDRERYGAGPGGHRRPRSARGWSVADAYQRALRAAAALRGPARRGRLRADHLPTASGWCSGARTLDGQLGGSPRVRDELAAPRARSPPPSTSRTASGPAGSRCSVQPGARAP